MNVFKHTKKISVAFLLLAAIAMGMIFAVVFQNERQVFAYSEQTNSSLIALTAIGSPQNLSFNQESGILTWDAVEGAMGYHIYSEGERITTAWVVATSVNLNTLGLHAGIHRIAVRTVPMDNNLGESFLSSTISFMSVHSLDAPIVSFDIDSQILSWTAVEGATGYFVYVENTRRTTTPILLTSVYISNLDLDVGISYVQVRAVSSAVYLLDSELSDLSRVTLNITLSAPVNVEVNQTTSVVSWNAVPYSTGYHIYVNNIRRTATPVLETSFNLATLSLAIGVNQVQVRAVSNLEFFIDSHLSALSDTTNIVYSVILNTPSLSIIQGSGILSWSAVQHAAGYHVYKLNNTSWERVTTAAIASLSVDLNSLPLPLGNQSIRLRAVNPAFYVTDSGLSDAVNFTVSTTLDVPVVTVNEQSRIISWTAVDSAETYRVYINNTFLIETRLLQINMGQLSLSNGLHFVRVRALSPLSYVHNSALSEVTNFIVGITLLSPTIAINGNIVSWNAVPNAEGYFVYVDGERKTDEKITTLSFNLSGIELDYGIYNIQVRATSSIIYRLDSILSTGQQFVLGTILGTPFNLSFNSVSFTLTWNVVPLATRYQVFVNGNMQAQTTALFVSISDLSLIAGENIITVRAVAERVDLLPSAMSLPFVKMTSVPLLPPTVHNFENGASSISWDAVEGAGGFVVYVNGQVAQILPSSARSISIARLELSEGQHSISIRALGTNGQSLDSELSQSQIIRIPPPPIVPVDEGLALWIILVIAFGGGILLVGLIVLTIILIVITSKKKEKNVQQKPNKTLDQMGMYAPRPQTNVYGMNGGHSGYAATTRTTTHHAAGIAQNGHSGYIGVNGGKNGNYNSPATHNGGYMHVSPRQQIPYRTVSNQNNNPHQRGTHANQKNMALPQGDGNKGHMTQYNSNLKSPYTQQLHPNSQRQANMPINNGNGQMPYSQRPLTAQNGHLHPKNAYHIPPQSQQQRTGQDPAQYR
ncbi:MAG: hypothetical protein FWE22_08595 [Firmicutes bacterium]|nr:hypothetical protein [Bacillota bacterium]